MTAAQTVAELHMLRKRCAELEEQFEGLVKIIMNPHLDLDVAAADAQDYIKALNPAISQDQTGCGHISHLKPWGGWNDIGGHQHSAPASIDSVERHEVTTEDEDRVVKAALEREDSAPASEPESYVSADGEQRWHVFGSAKEGL